MIERPSSQKYMNGVPYAAQSQYKELPNENQSIKGVIPLDTCPAGWWNGLWNFVTEQEIKITDDMDVIIKEIVAVIERAGIIDVTAQNTLSQAIVTLAQTIATSNIPGAVISSSDDGAVAVDNTGKMTLNGYNDLVSGLGDIADLDTTTKSSVVSAINEIIGLKGQPNGVATLDENGRIPYSQLPESAVEYKGEWNASTNTPTLVDGTGTNGSMYYVSVGGTQNLGSGSITFLEGDRIIYNGEDEVWQKLSGGTVKSVNSVPPDAIGNVQLSFSGFEDVLPISKGGTGATTAKEGFETLANSLTDSQNPADEERIIFKYADRLNWGIYTFLRFWDYIKNKISSVLGLTSAQYNGNSQTTNAIKVYDLDDGTDLDFVRVPGQYKIDSGTVTNAPDGITNEFNLEVFYVKSTYVCQRLTRYVTTGVTFIYVRTLIWTADNIWTGWRRLAYTDSTVAKAIADGSGNNIVDTYATKTEVSNTYAIKNYFNILFSSSHGRYVKIGSIPISSGTVSYANLVLGLFASSSPANYPVGFVNINISSGGYATGFNINGFSSIPLNLTDVSYPRIVVNKTDSLYELYVDCAYNYLRVIVYENYVQDFIRGNSETYDSLSGTEIFNSTTSDKIVYLDGTADTATYATSAENAITANTATYVVDSDQKLLDWANNVGGNDYSSVLIKKGTWTSSVTVNLTTCGTKAVVGEVGSLLTFEDTRGLYYVTVPTSSEYFMLNVNVSNSGSGTMSSTSAASCFFNCTNLTNCSGSGTISGTRGAAGGGFFNCTNLTNCSGSGTMSSTSAASTYGYGFSNCTNLTNCSGSGTTNRTASAYSYGFRNCTNLTNCSGSGTAPNALESSAYGYGFFNCTGVSKCKASKKCTTSVFEASYASQSENSTYACADTPAGGFNKTTNPSS